MQPSLRFRTGFHHVLLYSSSRFRGQILDHRLQMQSSGLVVMTYTGFHTLSSLTEIQVGNELLACGLK